MPPSEGELPQFSRSWGESTLEHPHVLQWSHRCLLRSILLRVECVSPYKCFRGAVTRGGVLRKPACKLLRARLPADPHQMQVKRSVKKWSV